MKIAIISFTKAGAEILGRLTDGFRQQGEACFGYVKQPFYESMKQLPGVCERTESLEVWTRRMFLEDRPETLIYIGAAGIAVRAAAPYLRDKMTDPAILVADEQGKFVISLVSGHVGGANAMAERAAGLIGAVPVITTASDVQGVEAIDVWAVNRGFQISDRAAAKRVAAAIVNGESVGFFSDYPVKKPAAAGYVDRICLENVWVTCRLEPTAVPAPCGSGSIIPVSDLPFSGTFEDREILRLVPRCLTVGIGCRKGVDAKRIGQIVKQTFLNHNLDIRGVCRIASIDMKKEEAGIRQTADRLGVTFVTYPAEELEKTEGSFTESRFVKQVTGVGSVCERAAVRAAGPGAGLLVRKTAKDGVTVAVAQSLWAGMESVKGGTNPGNRTAE